MKFEPLGNGFGLWVSENHIFGTDAILLANFAKAKPNDKMVDLGTGCGIIPFLLLRDGLLESAVGVDISEEATILAKKTKEELKAAAERRKEPPCCNAHRKTGGTGYGSFHRRQTVGAFLGHYPH